MSDTQGVAEISAVIPTADGPLLTCSPWATVDDLPEGCPCLVAESGGDTPDAGTLAELIDDATDALFVLLGRPAIGVCELTIYPCSNMVMPFLGPRHPHRRPIEGHHPRTGPRSRSQRQGAHPTPCVGIPKCERLSS